MPVQQPAKANRCGREHLQRFCNTGPLLSHPFRKEREEDGGARFLALKDLSCLCRVVLSYPTLTAKTRTRREPALSAAEGVGHPTLYTFRRDALSLKTRYKPRPSTGAYNGSDAGSGGD
jgi:hypothetical protein